MKLLFAAAVAAFALPAFTLPAFAQDVPSVHDQAPRELDPRQTAAEIAQTNSLNSSVLGRIEEIDRANAQAERDNAADLAAYQVMTAQADNDRATMEAEQASAARAYEAAQAQYRDDMAAWREAACRAGQRSACVPRY
jgi:hypothetical protein